MADARTSGHVRSARRPESRVGAIRLEDSAHGRTRRTIGVLGRVGLTAPGMSGKPGRMEVGQIEFIHRSWPADSAQLAVIRHELSGWLAPLRLTDEETAGVVLAVDEAAVNAVLHAYSPEESGSVELTLWTEPGPGIDDATLSIEVVDHGHWRQPESTVDGGRGIPLMSHVVESVLIHYDDRGSRVLLRQRLRAASTPTPAPPE